ncbi:DUF1761 domain-containing protein [Govanella unica]|uniref:DUF1761 domain-containing protein n=1 Tax=Govanella unica TaxID=2975056 RepID=A0A9X3TYJ8_9PROT|nr:DUF1761 domain-containing protein [Govania unica]MDA5193762.1 DUF1761 domain-containing protein [Govania unica]
MEGTINYAAIFVAALCNFVIWVIWYRRASAQSRLRESGVASEGPIKPPYLLFAGASLVMSIALAVMMAAAGFHTFAEGLLFGIIVGFGFAAMAVLPGFAMEMRPRWVYLLHAGAVALGSWAMAIVLASWR